MLRALLLSCLLAASAAAQPLTTDRPDFTESPLAVDAGRIQVELGATFQAFDFQGERTVFNTPEALVRVGVARGVELRTVLPEYTRVVREADALAPRIVTEDATDPSVGLKVELGNASGVDLGVIAETTVPVVESEFDVDRSVQTVIVTAAGDLSPRLSLGSQLSATYNETPDRVGLGATVVLGLSLDDQIGLFAELAASDPVDVAIDAEVLLHGGATLLLTDDLQLDAHAALGLTDTAPEYLVGVGASARF